MNVKQRKLGNSLRPAMVREAPGNRYVIVDPGVYAGEPILTAGREYSYKELQLCSDAVQIEMGTDMKIIEVIGAE